MGKIIGIIIVFGSVGGGYAAPGGHLDVLWQPFEFVIILGAAIGAFIIANDGHTIKATMTEFVAIFKKPKYNKSKYLELLSMLYTIFKMARTKGWLALEQHIEDPHNSDIFKQFPNFHGDHHAIVFLTDYLRIISLGSENPHELDALMDEEIDTMKEEKGHPAHAMQGMADGLPALGIVAAVLGVIHTMGSITEPPEVLGHLIGAALVGTFFGVFVSYGLFAPFASAIGTKNDAEVKYFLCIKVCILAFLQGAAPQVAVEFGRKILLHDTQPTFAEVEEATQNVNAPT